MRNEDKAYLSLSLSLWYDLINFLSLKTSLSLSVSGFHSFLSLYNLYRVIYSPTCINWSIFHTQYFRCVLLSWVIVVVIVIGSNPKGFLTGWGSITFRTPPNSPEVIHGPAGCRLLRRRMIHPVLHLSARTVTPEEVIPMTKFRARIMDRWTS